jgi:hypothetical protein
MNEPLRPLTLGEILDRTVQLYRRNFLLFAGSAAPPSVVIIAMFVAIAAVVGYFMRADGPGAAAHDVAIGILAVVALAVFLPLEIGATVVSQGALVRAALSVNLGRKLKIREAIRGVWPRFWRYLWLFILQGVFVGLIPATAAGALFGVLFLITRFAGGGGLGTGAAVGFSIFLIIAAAVVAMVTLLLVFCLAMPICVAEEKTAWASLTRSVKLTKGTRGRILLMLLLIWVLSVVVSMLAYIPMLIIVALLSMMVHGGRYEGLVLILSEVVNITINFAVQVLVTPVYATALVLFYFDQRIRTEGYDIEWMMEQAGLTGALAAAAPPNVVESGSIDTGSVDTGSVGPGSVESGSVGSGSVGSGPAGDAGAEIV